MNSNNRILPASYILARLPKRATECRLSIGAEVGDPIKPSMFDYYAVSKVAAERLVIESGLKYWVSLRQTGIIGKAMSEINDAIMFHNCFDNVLEYCSDRDSARAMKNLCAFYHDGDLPKVSGGIFTT